jgi:two-component system phosphate regulon sensor histidine kinase PhoR
MAHPSWNRHLARVAIAAVVTLVAGGWLSGYWLLVAVLALSAYAAWQLHNNWKLHRWLDHAENEPPESLGLWSDIFDRISLLEKQNKRQRKRLKHTIEEFEIVTNAFPDACLVLNRNDEISWFNEAAEKLLGLQHESDIGTVVTNLIREPDFADWLAVQDQVISHLEISCPRSPEIRLAISGFGYRKGQRLLILRDITGIYNLEKIRQDFVANVSHELRTPLTVLLGYLESFGDQCPQDIQPAIVKMLDQANNMRTLLDDLIELSRLQNVGHDLQEEKVNVPAIIGQLTELAQEIGQGNQTITTNVDSGLHLLGVPGDLQSAFGNLVQNAVKYAPEGSTIDISWQETGEGLVFAVSDDGPGIPARDVPRLTERFYRVGSDRSRESGGTGLGLAIVKHVLNAHGASLQIDTELGEGSSFRCIFPASRKSTQKAVATGS